MALPLPLLSPLLKGNKLWPSLYHYLSPLETSSYLPYLMVISYPPLLPLFISFRNIELSPLLNSNKLWPSLYHYLSPLETSSYLPYLMVINFGPPFTIIYLP